MSQNCPSPLAIPSPISPAPAVSQGPAHRRAEVVEVGGQAVDQGSLALRPHQRLGLLGEPQEVLGVAAAQRRLLPACLEPLDG